MAAAGESAESIIAALSRFGKYDLPDNVRADIAGYVSRYGRVKLVLDGDRLLLTSADPALLVEITHHRRLAPLISGQAADGSLVINRRSAGISSRRRSSSVIQPRLWPATCPARRWS